MKSIASSNGNSLADIAMPLGGRGVEFALIQENLGSEKLFELVRFREFLIYDDPLGWDVSPHSLPCTKSSIN